VSTGPSRSVPEYACPFPEQTEHIQKRARPQSVGLRFHANTRLVGLAAFSGSLFGLELVPIKWRYLVPPTSTPKGHNANRWAAMLESMNVHSFTGSIDNKGAGNDR
jgi:hypothetical protein